MLGSLLLGFLLSFNLFAESKVGNKKPAIEIPSRHISFQAGKLGDKPWNFDASFGVYVNFVGAVFSKLLYVDSQYRISPGLFQSWKWNFKDKSFEFEIKPGLQFSASRKLTPRDIEFAILKIFLSEKGKIFRDRLHQIVGVDELKIGEKYRTGMCRGVKIIGNSKIKIFLKKENPDFLFTLENGIPAIGPIEQFSDDLFNFKGTPLGTGDYFVEWSDPNSSLVRLKIKNYELQKTSSGHFPLTVDFYNEGSALENEIDVATAAGSGGIKKHEKYKTVLGHIPEAIDTLDFNFTHPLSQNLHLRKAIALAVDREKMYKDYPQNKPSYSIVPSKYLGRSDGMRKRNVEESREIVSTHLKGLFSRKNPLKGIYHGTPGAPKKPHIVELERQLAEAGIYINFEGRKVLIQFGEDRDAFIKENGNSVSFVDPLSSVSRFIPFPNEENLIANHKDKNLFILYKKVEVESDLQKRAESIKRLSSRIEDNFYTIPTGEGYPVFSYNNRVESIGLESIFAAIDFKKVVLRAK